ncbi:hypothetical protein ABTB65_18920, partial [Acinetobacter baumannii]
KAFVPTSAEMKGALSGRTIDVTAGDATAIKRELSLRTFVSDRLAGSARLATEKGVLQRVAMEVTGTEKVSEGTLTKGQFLDYAKARN